MLTKVTRLERIGDFRLRVRFSEGSEGEHDFGAVDFDRLVPRIGLQGTGEQFQCLLGVPCAFVDLSRLQPQFFGRRGDDALEKLAHHRFGQSPGKFVDQLTVDDGLDVGNSAHAELRRQFLVLVRVDLGEREPAPILVGKFFQDRRQRATRRAPRCPEIHDDRDFLRAFDHHLLEVLEVYVNRKRLHALPLKQLSFNMVMARADSSIPGRY